MALHDIGQQQVPLDKIWALPFVEGAMPLVIWHNEGQAIGIEIRRQTDDGEESAYLLMSSLDYMNLQRCVMNCVGHFRSIEG